MSAEQNCSCIAKLHMPIALDTFVDFLSRGYIVGFNCHQSLVEAMHLITDTYSLPLNVDSSKHRQEIINRALLEIEKLEDLIAVCYTKPRTDISGETSGGHYFVLRKRDFFDIHHSAGIIADSDIDIRDRIFVDCLQSQAVIPSYTANEISVCDLLDAVFES